jgi:hypothetical protein
MTLPDDAMHLSVMRERQAPGMQYQRRANARAEMLRIGGNRHELVGRDVEQQP